MKNLKGLNTICTHIGEVKDSQFKGAVSPIYMSSSYAYENVEVKRYPRYFNTPNQEALGKKIAALEKAEAGLIFGSGMAAISHCLMAFLKAGDHVVLQQSLYGGTYNFATTQLEKYGISFTFTKGLALKDFEYAIQPNTKVVYIETPSNPLLEITNIKTVAALAKAHNAISIIDNTFASPVNQNPITLGVDISLHSATKYMGGHSDLCAGAVACSKAHAKSIWEAAICFGGSLSDQTVWLLERSLKTMGLRVKAQNNNALQMANYLQEHNVVQKVYYPGLKNHISHDLAKSQMCGFGGMLSFELNTSIDTQQFLQNLQLIKPSMSLAGVESTMLLPSKTSHSLMPKTQRLAQGISDNLIRFSVGIEDFDDLQQDIDNAISKTLAKTLVAK